MLTKLNEFVTLVDTQALGEPNVVAAYLVTGKETALIDMGYQSSAEQVARDLFENGVKPDYLLPTHVHLDHCGSCGSLAKMFMGASILAHPKGEPHLVDPSRLWEGASQLFGDELVRKYGRPEPVPQTRVRVATNDDVIDLGREARLRVVWTPGHASHHLSYEWEGHQAFFTGDAVGIHFPKFPALIPTTPPTSFNMEEALQSLERIRASSPSHFYTPHYGLVTDAMRWITENVNALQHWLSMIRRMKEAGSLAEQISSSLTREVASILGEPVSELPDYLRISIDISVKGALRYLSRKPALLRNANTS